ncbi:uncharacterized protein LOC112573745 [Pomacea canaliculata]|uniref:uncharacterized protein LOC112573745 n=1 Tax=Pomacea canaliculata TaxID=400727 RepID=UPI000D731C39|nr:uncharacterized protein LOC112573745 [Pomacea canaliculata]
MSFSVTLLLSYIVFMSSISSTLPPNSLTVCLYSLYLAALMLLSTLCASVNVAIIAAYHSHTPAPPVLGHKHPGEGKECRRGCTEEGSQASYGLTMASSDSIPLSSPPARRNSFDSISLLPFQMTPSVSSRVKDMSIDEDLPCPCRCPRKLRSPPESPSALGGSGSRQGKRILWGKTLERWNKLAFYFTFGATLFTHVFFAILLVL